MGRRPQAANAAVLGRTEPPPQACPGRSKPARGHQGEWGWRRKAGRTQCSPEVTGAGSWLLHPRALAPRRGARLPVAQPSRWGFSGEAAPSGARPHQLGSGELRASVKDSPSYLRGEPPRRAQGNTARGPRGKWELILHRSTSWGGFPALLKQNRDPATGGAWDTIILGNRKVLG